jgi:hypothetical protein
MKTTNRIQPGKSIVAALLGTLLLFNTSIAMAQIYGVRRTTAVVSTPNRTVVASKTTVVGGTGVATLPHGYIATLPSGYRPVYVSGVRYYSFGGIYYRPQIYGGSTVYVAVRI